MIEWPQTKHIAELAQQRNREPDPIARLSRLARTDMRTIKLCTFATPSRSKLADEAVGQTQDQGTMGNMQ